jgi:iron transport multicopper oxidase
MFLLAIISALAVLSGTYAAIGPIADVHIVNKNIQPDGFNRPFVSSLCRSCRVIL